VRTTLNISHTAARVLLKTDFARFNLPQSVNQQGTASGINAVDQPRGSNIRIGFDVRKKFRWGLVPKESEQFLPRKQDDQQTEYFFEAGALDEMRT
jgi:hypothetical protein